MKLSRFFTHTVIVGLGFLALGFVGHQLLLGGTTEPITRARNDTQAHVQFVLLGAVSFAAGFVWLYSRIGNGTPRFVHALEFGVAIWLVRSVTLYINNCVIEPWPGVLVAKTLAWELISITALGILVAFLSTRKV